jgi:hypothetical protein
VHSSSGRYGADRQLHLIATGLDRERYEPIVVLPDHGPLAVDLRAAGIELHVHPVSVIRRELMSPRGAASILRAAAGDATRLSGLIRLRGVTLVHSNTSVMLGGAVAARVARVPHVWHVREIYARYGRAWPAYRRLLGSASALPCVLGATAGQFSAHEPVVVNPDCSRSRSDWASVTGSGWPASATTWRRCTARRT